MAMISQEGAPSLKVLVQISSIPMDDTTAENDGLRQSETRRLQHLSQIEEINKFQISESSFEYGLEGFAHIPSSDFYMHTRETELWNEAPMVDICGMILQKRFEQSGDIDEISNAISARQRRVQLTPDGHADMPSQLYNLGNSFLCRFERAGDPADISNAISNYQRAVELTPEGHTDMPGRLNNLGNSHLRRFESTGDLVDITDAISAYQKAIRLTPDGHADMLNQLSNLGDSYSLCFESTGDLTYITNAISTHQRVVQLTSNGHADLPKHLNSLGTSLLNRFQRTCDVTDITNAISAHQRATQLTPDGHAEMPGRLNNLGNSFLCRFERTGDLTDIASAISTHQRAVDLTPDGHIYMPSRLNNLGNSFLRRFGRTGDPTDIAKAISAHQRAIQLTPDGHADMPSWLGNLGISFSRRFGRTGDLTDITDAISAHQRAVELTPDGHADMPSQLNNLGTSFVGRFERTGNLTDIADAISAHQRAVELTPDGHADMPGRLNNLGNSFSRRFEQTADFADIAKAISAHRRAVQLTPDGHADMPGRLNNLGNSFLCRLKRTGDLSDSLEASSNYQRSVAQKSGPPSVRLLAARHWAQLSISRNPTDSLRAYGDLVNLLSEIAGMNRTIQQRHSSLVDISRLTATAASAAVSQGEVAMALEWLEQGRCLVWSQLNQLRTPVDNLRTANHLLADRFLHVSQALELSGSRQELTPLAIHGTISQKIALEDEARTHIMLAQEWDQLLDKIRKIPGFSNFLRPRPTSSIMKDLPRNGPIILINVHEDRCDALALVRGSNKPLHIPLEHLTHKNASQLKDRLHKYLVSGRYLMRDADRGPREVRDSEEKSDLNEILQELWLRVVKPILDALSYVVGPVSTHNMQSHSFANYSRIH